ncbi:MAG TPA: hypothetical protein P5527_01010 [Kiritimatiellia bacterium]|nr:hypothetical protein [Kiritimatiellia bacterium]
MRIRLFCVAACAAWSVFAAPQAGVELSGHGDVVPDTFRRGIAIYSDRSYQLLEPPKALAGRAYLRAPIDGFKLTVTNPGELICLTPKRRSEGGSSPCSQDDVLQGYGFELMSDPGEFQLFSEKPENRVRPWRKTVKAGEKFTFGKFVCVLAREPRIEIAEPINVDVGRQMFLDDLLVAESTMKRVWNKPTIDSRSPVLKPETELERSNNTRDPLWNAMAAPFSGGVWYDGQDKLFKCWYCAGWANGIAYATSKDGIKWERPDLDGQGNNLALKTVGMADSNAVIMDPDAKDGYRWKGFAFDLAGCTTVPGRRLVGPSVAVSKDGIHWTKTEMATDAGDCSTMFYNPFISKWVFSLRCGRSENGLSFGRWRDYAETDDFLNGSKNLKKMNWRLKGSAGGRQINGQELYNFDAVAYEGVMIGLALIYNSPQNSYWDKRGLPKIADLRFGFNSVPNEYDAWQFPAEHAYDFFLEGTRKYGDWNMGYLRSNAAICLVMGDELWFYFSGFAGQPDKKKEFSRVNTHSGTYANATMGIAKLRRDGFCSLSDGTLTTKKLVFTKGDRLWVNVDAREGELDVVSGGWRKTLKGVDSTRLEVGPLAPNESFTLTFTARGGARLYSFWTSDAKGRSGGYLAGGSPESRTLRDED